MALLHASCGFHPQFEASYCSYTRCRFTAWKERGMKGEGKKGSLNELSFLVLSLQETVRHK